MNTEEKLKKEIGVFFEAFSVNGAIQVEHVGFLLRFLNYNPTEAEIAELIQYNKEKNDGTREINKDQFWNLLKKHEKMVRSKKEKISLDAAFDKIMNKQKSMDTEKLRLKLTAIGDKLEDTEFELLLEIAKVKQVYDKQKEKINIDDLKKLLEEK